MPALTTDQLKKLGQKKYRQQYGHFLAEGEHLVLELQKAAASQPALLASELYVSEAYRDWPGPLAKQVVSDKLIRQLSETSSPQGIVACVPLEALVGAGAGGGFDRGLYLHAVQDPGNLGTILRSLAWFGGFRCLLGPGSVDPCNAKVVRASMGGIFHVPIETDVRPETLPQRYGDLACLDLAGASIRTEGFRRADCLLFGSEARGLPDGLPEQLGAGRFSIPGRGAVESLNLASTVNICLYEASG